MSCCLPSCPHGRPGTGPCGDSMRGHRDMGQQGWNTNRHPQIGDVLPILSCKPHSQRAGLDRAYFTCASWFYLNFPISPSLEHAQTQSHADHRVWASPGPASRRWQQGCGLPDLPTCHWRCSLGSSPQMGNFILLLFMYFSNQV